MPAYLIADIEITDPAAFEQYRKEVPPTIAKYGGRYVVRGGATEVVEGDWRPNRLIVLEFPTMAQARRWYECEEYRGPKALRIQASRSNVIFVEGV